MYNFIYTLEKTIKRTLFNQVICFGLLLITMYYDLPFAFWVVLLMYLIGMLLAFYREITIE